MATLFVLQGRDQGKRFELRGPSLTLGREAANPLHLADTEVSRRHAEIRKDEEGYTLVDLNSSNGSFVNPDRVSERRLKNGDRVQLGRTLLLFTDADERSAVPLAEDVGIYPPPTGELPRAWLKRAIWPRRARRAERGSPKPPIKMPVAGSSRLPIRPIV